MIKKTARFLLILAAALAAYVPGVKAQEVARLEPVVVVANAAADKVQKKAEALYENRKTLFQAAVLHEQEAAMRSDADPRKAVALDRAARLYTYSGNQTRALPLMEKSARTYLKRGDIAQAAHTFIDAAFLALAARDVSRAAKLTHEADMLLQSPLLATAAKMEIVKRIDPARATLGANY